MASSLPSSCPQKRSIFAFWCGDLYPSASTALVKVAKADGTTFEVSIAWRRKNSIDARTDLVSASTIGRGVQLRVAQAYESGNVGLLNMGKENPFFVNEESIKALGFAKVVPDARHLKAYGQKKAAPIFAALYRHQGKVLLLVRQAGYIPAEGWTTENFIGTYKAILSQYEGVADVVIIDQTHNPGGSVFYVSEMAKLFAKNPLGNFVQANRADRRWSEAFQSYYASEKESGSENALAYLSSAKAVEAAYDAGEFLTKPLPFSSQAMLTAGDYVWQKPVLVLIDELSGSGGDAFPMILKYGGAAKLFGKRTMGLGGSLEEMQLLNSRATIGFTRGLFTSYKTSQTYTPEDFIENIGVQPDVAWEHTVADVRGGYLAYIKAFSDEAAALAGE